MIALELAAREVEADGGRLSDFRASSSRVDRVGRFVASLSVLPSLATNVSSPESLESEMPRFRCGLALFDRGEASDGDNSLDLGEILGVDSLGS